MYSVLFMTSNSSYQNFWNMTLLSSGFPSLAELKHNQQSTEFKTQYHWYLLKYKNWEYELSACAVPWWIKAFQGGQHITCPRAAGPPAQVMSFLEAQLLELLLISSLTDKTANSGLSLFFCCYCTEGTCCPFFHFSLCGKKDFSFYYHRRLCCSFLSQKYIQSSMKVCQLQAIN